MKVPSYPDDVAMALIEEELGQPWQNIYSELSSSPIAAGSLRDNPFIYFSEVHLVPKHIFFLLQWQHLLDRCIRAV